MSSSDGEDEAVPQSVANYHFVDDKDEPITFSVLPIQWSDNESPEFTKKQIFLHGTADGFQKIYKQVISWKFELSDAQPEISVLSKERNWINLQKPRKSFEDTIRTILITVQCLHFVRKNPDTSSKSLWEHIRKVFCSYDVLPSENDLLDNMLVIRAAVQRDNKLAKSKYLLTFLEEKPRKRSLDEDVQCGSDAKIRKFIVDDEDMEGDESDEENDLFDSVCAFCDNGGTILCCEGRCLRSFHATRKDGAESQCESLGLSRFQVEAITNFLCKNCQYKQHQCFACGKLGSSDKANHAEVFHCASATCGHFYHPQCVARLLHRGDDAKAQELEKKIAVGETFTCPVHKCLVCKQGEKKEDDDLQFAVCRRCPKAYHRKCLPREIAFEDLEDDDIIQRAWDDLLPNRILIYCLEHDIDEDIGTPVRDHILFPYVEEKKKKRPFELQSGKEKISTENRTVGSDDSTKKNTVRTLKQLGKVPSAVRDGSSVEKSVKQLSGQGYDLSKKSTIVGSRKPPLKEKTKPVSDTPSTAEESKLSLREEKLNSVLNRGLEPVKSKQKDVTGGKLGTMTVKPVLKKSNSSSSVDPETKKRILDLIQCYSSSITLEKITEKFKMPVTHAHSSKNMVDRTITQGKVEGSVEAARAALQKFEEGWSIDDVKELCAPDVLYKLVQWKNKLRVYLAPFLHGMRYTSFGRHFTKIDKLKEIADMLHSYVQPGDTIVDFCCGANDFSWLMKEKLEETGRKCSFRNYDHIQPKNDFCFEKRDWMKVWPKELPTGSQLIMGLNPPFGVKGALANQFIDKALEFKPKILILIVPPETERLDEKESPYDLIWEDDKKLSGKSFYLPGSVDVNDKQMDQWNVKPPLLSLWSRPDWTARHREIALKQGHISKEQRRSSMEKNNLNDARVSDHSPKIKPVIDNRKEDDHDHYIGISKSSHILSRTHDLPEQKNETEPEETRTVVPEEQKESFPLKHDVRVIRDRHDKSAVGEGHDKHHNRKRNQSSENPKEWQDKKRQTKAKADAPSERKYDSVRPQSREKHSRTPPVANSLLDRTDSRNLLEPQSRERHSRTPPVANSLLDRTDPRNLLESHSSEGHEIIPERAVNDESSRHFQPGLSGSGLGFLTGYGGNRSSFASEDFDDIERRYSLSSGNQFSGGTHIGATGSSSTLPQEYGVRGSIEEFSRYTRDGMDKYGGRSYVTERDEFNRREDIRSQLRLYGQQNGETLPRSSTLQAGQSLSSTPYGLMGSASDSSYQRMNSSAMQRYAPRLDELNHTRMSTYGADTSGTAGRSAYDVQGTQSGFHVDSIGFVPGPQRPFSHHNNSSGWLNE
ncbi:protein ENHANCED DOWNY MILDEW 2-like isoform X2 [Telopea speciosissima]|uniref:protein ENHANCED DOWNY MILDEW 2-like isoform X2 n=1 Tax=Telopea speciosissima TaxID=54955 RepID=UPI001CC454B9|nr:protein ENHANCED DOWNY MILDEW 2-like isoform X2 [Telopea speciosissima]